MSRFAKANLRKLYYLRNKKTGQLFGGNRGCALTSPERAIKQLDSWRLSHYEPKDFEVVEVVPTITKKIRIPAGIDFKYGRKA